MSWLAQTKKWTLEECVKYAIDNNISIKQTELEVKTANIDKKDAIGKFLPSLNATASHSWNIGLNQDITTGLLQNQTTQLIDIYNMGSYIQTSKTNATHSINNHVTLDSIFYLDKGTVILLPLYCIDFSVDTEVFLSTNIIFKIRVDNIPSKLPFLSSIVKLFIFALYKILIVADLPFS